MTATSEAGGSFGFGEQTSSDDATLDLHDALTHFEELPLTIEARYLGVFEDPVRAEDLKGIAGHDARRTGCNQPRRRGETVHVVPAVMVSRRLAGQGSRRLDRRADLAEQPLNRFEFRSDWAAAVRALPRIRHRELLGPLSDADTCRSGADLAGCLDPQEDLEPLTNRADEAVRRRDNVVKVHRTRRGTPERHEPHRRARLPSRLRGVHEDRVQAPTITPRKDEGEVSDGGQRDERLLAVEYPGVTLENRSCGDLLGIRSGLRLGERPARLAAAPEEVRRELFRQFGYYVTESTPHLSEYLPYFRRNPDLMQRYSLRRRSPEDFAQRWQTRRDDRRDKLRQQAGGAEPIPMERSSEYSSYIIEAMQTDKPYRVNVNVRNTGLITNLPSDCVVEVPCLVDGLGVHPCHVGPLPPQLAALNRTNINVQELAVKAALTGDQEALYQAVALDPLTSARLSFQEIRSMVDEMFEALLPWMPQFQNG